MFALMQAEGSNDITPDRVETRLATLRTELGITDAQQARWLRLAEALRADADEMRAMTLHRASLGSAPAQMQPLPDRLRQKHVMIERHQHSLSRIEHATRTLYASFSAPQRTRADALLRCLAGC